MHRRDLDFERNINGCAIGERLAMRRERVAQLVSDLATWMRENALGSPATTMSIRRWRTCSRVGTPSRACSTMAGFA